MRIVSLVLVLATACVNGDPPDRDDPDPTPMPDPTPDPMPPNNSISATEFLTALDHKDCDDAFACKATFVAEPDWAFDDLFGTSAAECYGFGTPSHAKVEASIVAGRVKYDGVKAKTCVANLPGAPVCATYWDQGPAYPAACDDVIAGTVATGGACTTGWDCASLDDYCGASQTCVAIPATGLAMRARPPHF